MPRPVSQAGRQPAQAMGNNMTDSFLDTVRQQLKYSEEAAAMEAPAQNGGARPAFQKYLQSRSQEQDKFDRRHMGFPVPVIVLGVAGTGHRVGIALLEEILASRNTLSKDCQLYIPVLGMADGRGSMSPHERVDYTLAVSCGLTNASIQMVIDETSSGNNMEGNGYKDTRDVVDKAGQAGCIVFDVNEDPRARAKILPGMLKAGEEGYYGVVVGTRPEAHMKLLKKAFGDGQRLLVADLRGSATGGGAAGGPSKAQRLLQQTIDWYLPQPAIKEELANRAKGAEANFQPKRKRDLKHQQAQLQADGGACPCGCSNEDVANHMAGLMSMCFLDPSNAVRKLGMGDYQMAMAIGNIFCQALPESQVEAVTRFTDAGLIPVLFDQLACAVDEGHYGRLYGMLICAGNMCLFTDEAGKGDWLRREMLKRGLAAWLTIGRGCKDANVRTAAVHIISQLREGFSLWLRKCASCDKLEDEPDQYLLCAACKSRCYCGRDCQKAHWKQHKPECKRLAVL